MKDRTFESEILDVLAKEADLGYAFSIGIGQNTSIRKSVTTFPNEWLAVMVKEGHFENDPVLLWASGQTGTIAWRDVPVTEKSAAVMERAKDFGLINGTSISIVYAGEKSALSLCHTAVNLDSQQIANCEAALYALSHLNPPPETNDKTPIIMDMLCQGLSDKDISDKVGLGIRSVREKKKQILDKLKAKTIAHAVSIYKQTGLI